VHAGARYALPLTGIVVVSTFAWALIGRIPATPWIFPDELIYSEVAKSLAGGHLPAVREVASSDFGFVYPALLAPAWVLFEDVEKAYSVARLINAAVMSLAAVPAFFLTRRFTTDSRALAVAALSVVLPSMAYTGTLMTEVALYPAFLLALLAITTSFEQPTRRNQVLALAAICLAFGVKPSAGALVPAYLTGTISLGILDPRTTVRRQLHAFRFTWVLAALGVGVAVAAGIALSGDPAAALGAYAVVAHHFDVLRAVPWFAANLAGLGLLVGGVPLAATAIVMSWAWRRRDDVVLQRYAAVTVPVVAAMTAVVALFASEPVAGADGFVQSTALRERNLFFVAPLFLIGVALWMDRRPVSMRASAVAGALVVLGALFYPFGDVPVSISPQNLAPYLFLTLPHGLVRGLTAAALVGLLLAVWLLVPSTRMGRVWMGLGAWFALTGAIACVVFAAGSHRTAEWALAADPEWVDHALPSHQRAAVVWLDPEEDGRTVRRRHRVVWVTEFFNRSVGRVYSGPTSMPYDLPENEVHVAGRRLVGADGRDVRERFVIARCPVAIDGRVVAKHGLVRLYEVDGSVRLAPSGGRAGCS
jgi:hypothetical protein